jgi:hypothetical protein
MRSAAIFISTAVEMRLLASYHLVLLVLCMLPRCGLSSCFQTKSHRDGISVCGNLGSLSMSVFGKDWDLNIFKQASCFLHCRTSIDLPAWLVLRGFTVVPRLTTLGVPPQSHNGREGTGRT